MKISNVMKKRILSSGLLFAMFCSVSYATSYHKLVQKYDKEVIVGKSKDKVSIASYETDDSIRTIWIEAYEDTMEQSSDIIRLADSDVKELIQDLEEFQKLYMQDLPAEYTEYSWEHSVDNDKSGLHKKGVLKDKKRLLSYTMYIYKNEWHFALILSSDNSYVYIDHSIEQMNQILAMLKEAVAAFEK